MQIIVKVRTITNGLKNTQVLLKATHSTHKQEYTEHATLVGLLQGPNTGSTTALSSNEIATLADFLNLDWTVFATVFSTGI